MNRLTNTQITVVLVTALLCLGLPAGALAANLSKVVVAGSNGKTAKVKSGKLQVKAAVSGTVKTSTSGTVKTAQQGTVTTQLASPSTFFHSYDFAGTTACKAVVVMPANRDVVVRQVRMNVYSLAAPGTSAYVTLHDAANCNAHVASFNPTGLGQVTATFDPGLAMPAGSKLYALVGTGVSSEFFADGYTLPAGSVPPLRPRTDKVRSARD